MTIAELFAMSVLVAFLCLPLYSLCVASIFDDWFAAMANASLHVIFPCTFGCGKVRGEDVFKAEKIGVVGVGVQK